MHMHCSICAWTMHDGCTAGILWFAHSNVLVLAAAVHQCGHTLVRSNVRAGCGLHRCDRASVVPLAAGYIVDPMADGATTGFVVAVRLHGAMVAGSAPARIQWTAAGGGCCMLPRGRFAVVVAADMADWVVLEAR